MESHPKSASVHRQPSLLALLCLVVFLLYLLLPAVYALISPNPIIANSDFLVPGLRAPPVFL